MKINFWLNFPKKAESPIRIIINHRGKSYRQNSGLSCKTKDWSVAKQRCSNAAVQDKMREIRNKLEALLDDNSTERDILAALNSLKIDSLRMPVRKAGMPTLWEYFSNVDGLSPAMCKLRRGAYNCIHDLMGDDIDWQDVDSAFFFELKRKMVKAKLSLNTQANYAGVLKSVMKDGFRLKYHDCTDYEDFRIRRELPDTIYLTEEELQMLWDVHLDSETEKKARDLFLLGVYTAARYSDCVNFSKKNLFGNKFRYTQKKTGQSVIMPLSPKVKLLLQRNGGAAPQLSLPVYDRAIKSVAMKAGIIAQTEVTRTKGARHKTDSAPKCDFIGSHTARRTGCTLLYKSGVPLKVCMYLSGHTSESNFLRYIRITKEEGADMLAKLDFFR